MSFPFLKSCHWGRLKPKLLFVCVNNSKFIDGEKRILFIFGDIEFLRPFTLELNLNNFIFAFNLLNDIPVKVNEGKAFLIKERSSRWYFILGKACNHFIRLWFFMLLVLYYRFGVLFLNLFFHLWTCLLLLEFNFVTNTLVLNVHRLFLSDLPFVFVYLPIAPWSKEFASYLDRPN